MRDLTNPLQNWLYLCDDTRQFYILSAPCHWITVLPISLCVTAAVCVTSFTAVFYEFVQLSQLGYIAVCFWYVASICKPWVWWINPAWRATQADTKSSCNRSSLQISHYWFWILKIFSFVSFGVFFCDALILLICVFLYVNLYERQNCIKDIYLN